MLSLLPDVEQAAYRRYAVGERTDETRAAKRVYMQIRRDAARARRLAFELSNPGVRYVVEGITHGIGGYTNEGCRCRTCNLAWKGIKA
jgi:hypothetical protein